MTPRLRSLFFEVLPSAVMMRARVPAAKRKIGTDRLTEGLFKVWTEALRRLKAHVVEDLPLRMREVAPLAHRTLHAGWTGGARSDQIVDQDSCPCPRKEAFLMRELVFCQQHLVVSSSWMFAEVPLLSKFPCSAGN